MINALAKIFVKNYENTDDPKVRSAWGFLCSLVTIGLNIIMFVAKYITGLVAGSVSIMADSFNNLSDAGSSVLILLGFNFAGMKPTPERPFGHGRIEYVTGLAVSVMILLVGFSTLKDAVDAILHPEDQLFSVLTVVILLLSVAIKFYMAYYGKKIGEKIDSQALKAAAAENMTDTISTVLTLASLILNHTLGWKLDGWVAAVVAVLLLKAGVENGWETLKDLLGKKADPELVKKVEDIAMSYDEIIGVHDLIVHDYGPGRLYISLHCEVPGSGNVYDLHDAMDRCMLQLDKELGCESVIHMDPVNTDDEEVTKAKEETVKILRSRVHSEIMIHDFRIITGPTHNNYVFDAVVPFDSGLTEDQAAEKIKEAVKAGFEHPTFAIVKIDRPYA